MRRTAREAGLLGLWTASWLFVVLLVLLAWLGDLALQWPVLLVPVAWAALAVRRVRRGRAALRRPGDAAGPWPPDEPRRRAAPPRSRPAPGHRGAPRDRLAPGDRLASRDRTPPTRELPWLPDVPRDRREG